MKELSGLYATRLNFCIILDTFFFFFFSFFLHSAVCCVESLDKLIGLRYMLKACIPIHVGGRPDTWL